MALFSYIDKGGAKQNIEARTPEEAISIAPNADPSSGVQQNPGTPVAPTTTYARTPLEIAGPAQNTYTKTDPTTNGPESPYYSRYDGTDTRAKLDATTGSAPDLATIQSEKQAAADKMIQEIRAQFASALTSENAAGAARNDRVRALNIGSGLGGSNFGSSAAQVQEDKNKGAVDLLSKEYESRIANILSEVDQRASQEYKDQLATYRSNLEGDLTRQNQFKDEQRKKALDTFTGLASSGVTWDAFKANEPDAFKQTIDEFGGSEVEAKAAYNNSLPDNLRTKYTDKIVQDAQGNAVIHRYGINPITNKLDQYDIPTGKSYYDFTGENGTSIVYQDGTFYSQKKGADGSISLKPITTTPKTQSDINKNNRAPAEGTFKLTQTQTSKLISSGFSTTDLKAMQDDLAGGATIDQVVQGLAADKQQIFKDALSASSDSGA